MFIDGREKCHNGKQKIDHNDPEQYARTFGSKGEKYCRLKRTMINDSQVFDFIEEYKDIPLFQKISEMLGKSINYDEHAEKYKKLYENLCQITVKQLHDLNDPAVSISPPRMVNIPYKYSPFECIQKDDLEGLKIWLKNGESPNGVFDNISMLDYSINNKKYDFIKALLQEKASLNYRSCQDIRNLDIAQLNNKRSNSIFFQVRKAIITNDLELMKIFVEYSKIPDDVMDALLLESVNQNAFDIAEFILSKGARNAKAFITSYTKNKMFYFNHHKNTQELLPFEAAKGVYTHILYTSDLNELKDFLDNLNIEGKEKLFQYGFEGILKRDKIEMAAYLIDHNKGNQKLMDEYFGNALESSNSKIAKLLYENGAKVDEETIKSKYYYNGVVCALVILRDLGYPLPPFRGLDYDVNTVTFNISSSIDRAEYLRFALQNYDIHRAIKKKKEIFNNFVMLFSAIEEGNVEKALMYSSTNHLIISTDPVEFAMKHNQLEVFKALFKETENKNVSVYLMEALKYGKLDFATFIAGSVSQFHSAIGTNEIQKFHDEIKNNIDFMVKHSIPFANNSSVINNLMAAKDDKTLEYVMTFPGTSESYESSIFKFAQKSGNKNLLDLLIKASVSSSNVCSLTLNSIIKCHLTDVAERIINEATELNPSNVIKTAYEQNFPELGRKIIAKFGMPQEKSFNVILFASIIKCNDLETLSKYMETEPCKNPKTKQDMAVGIMIAASRGNIEIIKKLVAIGVPAALGAPLSSIYKLGSISDASYNSALIAACAKNNMEIFDYLLELGSPLIIKGQREFEALNEAALNGSLEIIPKLVSLKNNVRYLNKAAWFAVLGNHLDALKMLVGIGANINYCFVNQLNKIPLLSKAVLLQEYEIAYYLIEEGAIIGRLDGENNSALFYAFQKGDFRFIVYLLQFWKVFPKIEINRCLSIAVEKQYVFLIRLLLSIGADPSYLIHGTNETAFNKACKIGYTPIINLLIEYANLDAEHMLKVTPEMLALKNNDVNLMEILVERGCKIEYRNNTESLFLASYREKSFEFLEYLLNSVKDFSALLDEIKRDLGDLLFSAYQNKDKKLMFSLLDRGVDPNICNSDVLYKACRESDIPTIELLVKKYGATFKNSHYQIKNAIEESDFQTFQKMLELGLDPNIKGVLRSFLRKTIRFTLPDGKQSEDT